MRALKRANGRYVLRVLFCPHKQHQQCHLLPVALVKGSLARPQVRQGPAAEQDVTAARPSRSPRRRDQAALESSCPKPATRYQQLQPWPSSRLERPKAAALIICGVSPDGRSQRARRAGLRLDDPVKHLSPVASRAPKPEDPQRPKNPSFGGSGGGGSGSCCPGCCSPGCCSSCSCFSGCCSSGCCSCRWRRSRMPLRGCQGLVMSQY